MATLRLGQLAPDFTLTVHDGTLFTLSEAVKTKKIVLVFYPVDGSPTCTKLLCRINDDSARFAAAGLQLVGINHAEPDAHRVTATLKLLELPLLSDPNYQVARLYGSLFEIGPIKAIRYLVIGIDHERRVTYARHGRPSNSEIMTGMGISQPA
jgi:peroxiredoxin Q/BCP